MTIRDEAIELLNYMYTTYNRNLLIPNVNFVITQEGGSHKNLVGIAKTDTLISGPFSKHSVYHINSLLVYLSDEDFIKIREYRDFGSVTNGIRFIVERFKSKGINYFEIRAKDLQKWDDLLSS